MYFIFSCVQVKTAFEMVKQGGPEKLKAKHSERGKVILNAPISFLLY
jgi:hypothetical protein